MFNFRKMLYVPTNRVTGLIEKQLFNIVEARLVSGDGYKYDESPDGANMFEIDLEPVNSECEKSVYGLTIVVGNSGDWVKVQRGLDPKAEHETEPGRFELDTVDALIGKDHLLVIID